MMPAIPSRYLFPRTMAEVVGTPGTFLLNPAIIIANMSTIPAIANPSRSVIFIAIPRSALIMIDLTTTLRRGVAETVTIGDVVISQ
jgi:hypothetical protein